MLFLLFDNIDMTLLLLAVVVLVLVDCNGGVDERFEENSRFGFGGPIVAGVVVVVVVELFGINVWLLLWLPSDGKTDEAEADGAKEEIMASGLSVLRSDGGGAGGGAAFKFAIAVAIAIVVDAFDADDTDAVDELLFVLEEAMIGGENEVGENGDEEEEEEEAGEDDDGGGDDAVGDGSACCCCCW